MSIECVVEEDNSTVLVIKRSSPYFPDYSYQIKLAHTPSQFSSLPPLPTALLASSNVTRTITQDFDVPGRRVFLITSIFTDGSNITEGPFKS